MTTNFIELPNLLSQSFNSAVVFATDEWFAECDNLLKDSDAIWREDIYTDFGKWMDGWESRRRRTAGHDWCILKLGLRGKVKGLDIDTSFFTGNFSPIASIQYLCSDYEPEVMKELMSVRQQAVASKEIGRMGTCASSNEWGLVSQLQSEKWPFLLEPHPLGAGVPETRHNYFETEVQDTISYVRLNMGPDGGIARLRLFGLVTTDISAIPLGQLLDLAAVEHGGFALSCSNKHYGKPSNMLTKGRGTCMGDGWETARQPKRPPVYTMENGLLVLPGYDWAIIKLGIRGCVHQLLVDTHFYKGNYPESCSVEACDCASGDAGSGPFDWTQLLPRTILGPDAIHEFSVSAGTLLQVGDVSHLRLTIYPDGGVMRLRAIGTRSALSSRL